MNGPTTRQISTMLRAYIACALWSTNDESNESGGEPLDKNYGPENLSNETLDAMRSDVERFARENYATLCACEGRIKASDLWSQAGHDLWLNRNGHGCVFWETPDWPEKEGEVLDASAHAFGEVYLYVGDDGQIHQS